jgi:hypothetical protein
MLFVTSTSLLTHADVVLVLVGVTEQIEELTLLPGMEKHLWVHYSPAAQVYTPLAYTVQILIPSIYISCSNKVYC